MAEFVSTFITGFQDVVKNDLPKRLKGIKIISLLDGLIHYSYCGNSRDLQNIIYFNNTFFVIKTFNTNNITFNAMVSAAAKVKSPYLINRGKFRIRFNKENQFCKVEKDVTRRAETLVLNNSKLQIDRVNPDTEFWYLIRRENFSFCGQLISKREFTEKNLNKGELRPEIAYLISSFAEIKEGDSILDCFCGYGSIPVQLAKKFNFAKLYASDIDEQKISMLKEKKALQNNQNIYLCREDAFCLNYLQDKSIDTVITDPPWGYYEEIDDLQAFYNKMFASLKRVLKDDGKMIILSARKEELEKCAQQNKIEIKNKLQTLVNGKKAALYSLQFIK